MARRSCRKRGLDEVEEDDVLEELDDGSVVEAESSPKAAASGVVDENLLRVYYSYLFPFKEMFQWLSYSSSAGGRLPKDWTHREFSFTIKNDVYIRHKSYATLEAFRKDVVAKCPLKMDIGAIYNVEPSKKSTISSDHFIPEEKELVFDIDISDYDDVRECCKAAAVCSECWPLMTCAIQVLAAVLRDDFGYENLLFVFSGRRGIHCWVCDKSARALDTYARGAVVDYMRIATGGGQRVSALSRSGHMTFIHDSMQRAFSICVGYFVNCSIALQRVFEEPTHVERIQSLIRDATVRERVRKLMASRTFAEMDATQQWAAFEKEFAKYSGKGKIDVSANLMEVVLMYTYPRLDAEVSKHTNHLLKSPFVVHPKTGKICTVIDEHSANDFDPNKQPTVFQLYEEYAERHSDETITAVVDTFKQTFLNKLLADD